MNPHLNLCPKCEHVSYCVLTHNHSVVFDCSDFDEKRNQNNTPKQPTLRTINIKKRELETV